MGLITKEMKIADALEQGNQQAIADALFNFGMHCFGCALAKGETVEEAAMAHGVDIDDMLDALNEAANS